MRKLRIFLTATILLGALAAARAGSVTVGVRPKRILYPCLETEHSDRRILPLML